MAYSLTPPPFFIYIRTADNGQTGQKRFIEPIWLTDSFVRDYVTHVRKLPGCAMMFADHVVLCSFQISKIINKYLFLTQFYKNARNETVKQVQNYTRMC